MGYDDLPAGDSSRVARIYQELKWKIICGRYRPGKHISEATRDEILEMRRATEGSRNGILTTRIRTAVDDTRRSYDMASR